MTQSHLIQPQYSLEGVALLKGIPYESLQRVQQSCRWRRYERGEPIVEYLDRSNDVFFLISGKARAIIYSLAGKVVSFHELGPGDLFGEYVAIDGRPRSASVEARTSCLVASMTAADFRTLLQTEPTADDALHKQLVATVRRLSTRVYEFSAAVMAITGRRIYAEMQGIRAKDKYPDEETVIRVFGVSRYDRIAKKLDIERHLSWPELLPFFEGVAEEMRVKCKIDGDLKNSARKVSMSAFTDLPYERDASPTAKRPRRNPIRG